MLNVGDKAPLFSLKNQNNDLVELKKVLSDGHKVLLVIYPKDDTPGCTAQMCRVRDDYSEFEKLGVKVYGLNHDSATSHIKFIEKYNFPFDILIDENRKIIKEYGSTKMFFKNETTQRGAYLIDTSEKIIFAQKGQQDNQEILDLLKK